MSFEIQELPDVIKIIILLSVREGVEVDKSLLKRRVDKYCAGYVCVEKEDFEKALKEIANEGLIHNRNGKIMLTSKGAKLSEEWKSLLLKREPIMEFVAGLTDGSITGLVIILSAFLAGLTTRLTLFAAFLTLTSVAITNFSSFLLGGKTEDMADLTTLKTLIDHSLSDIPDREERDKSLQLVRRLFTILRREISHSNLVSAIICATTTFLAGSIPTIAYLMLPEPLDLILSLAIVCLTVGVFLVHYRSKRTKVHWKITLLETVTIVIIAVAASLLLGRI